MERYGVKHARKAVHLHKEFRYENLKETLHYAEVDAQRERSNTLPGADRK